MAEVSLYCGVCFFETGLHYPLSRHGTGADCKLVVDRTVVISPKLCITPRTPHVPTLWCSRCHCERHPGSKVPITCSVMSGLRHYSKATALAKVTANDWCDIDAVVMQ